MIHLLLAALVVMAAPLQALDADHDHDHGDEIHDQKPKASPIPKFNPRAKPIVTGEFLVGVVVISFRDTHVPMDLERGLSSLNQVSVNPQHAESGGINAIRSSRVDLETYFKQYTNEITWPKLVLMHEADAMYQDPHLYGYYCKYDFWNNPVGWHEREEGVKRVREMNERAIRFAKKSSTGHKPRFVCYNYITRRIPKPDEALEALITDFYKNRNADPDRTEPIKERDQANPDEVLRYEPMNYYRPQCRWGEPMWPNSKIQIHDFNGSVMAHELGHCLGAPDVYRVGRYNDGIGGEASLMAYGPTANAFSRFYHHAYIKQKNHPGIIQSGTYTLHPRHITPKGDEALGYLIASNHPHYMYHVEYIHNEDGIAGVGPSHEGMLISVVNLGLKNYLGSPDYFYVYRPNDPFFRGKGNTGDCLFGQSHKRTEFNMNTEPSSRLPNLMDGGISVSNIREQDGILTFDLEMKRSTVQGREYTESMLPQIRLDGVRDVRPTSFAMDCTIKFRGEPLITNYGFCWSTSKNPTVRDSTYSMAHRECYRGHAIDLKPDTTYYVRAFASNGVGVRYSDEEITVETPDFQEDPGAIAPLCTDYFASNLYLLNRYSVRAQHAESEAIDYSPTCVLAQLIAYYRPDDYEIMSRDERRPKPEDFDFDQLSWNPSRDDFPMRLEEVDRFFSHIYGNAHRLGFLGDKPGEKFTENLETITGFRTKPVLSQLAEGNEQEVAKRIREDLKNSRPAFLFFSSPGRPMRWVTIDGMDANGSFHLNFPLGSKLAVNLEDVDLKRGYRGLESLHYEGYSTYVVTSCHPR